MAKRTAKRPYDSEATRKRILDAAARAFQTNGYHATSMHDLMEAADVPGGSMYHYFPTKKKLALAVIEERVKPALHETWIAPLSSATTAREAILAVFDDVASSIERRNGSATGCPVSNLAVELVLADRDFQRAFDALFRLWGNAVLERLRHGARNAPDERTIEALATTIVATFSGAMTLAKTMRSASPIRDTAASIERLLNAG